MATFDDKWDNRFMEMAQLVGSWSRDPSTKVGAVVVRPDRTIASVAFNGFPRGVIDRQEFYDDREEKYPRTVHAELNAILMATEKLTDFSIYVSPLFPCSTCAGAIIQSGIRRVVSNRSAGSVKWRDSGMVSLQMFLEAGVQLVDWNRDK